MSFPPPERLRLHARIAESLEALYSPDADAHAAELAHHYAEAQTVLGTDKLIHYSRLAGERALAAYAWEEAMFQFERGLVLKGVSLSSQDPAQDPQEAVLLFGLGQARVGALPVYRLAEGVTLLRRAFDYYAHGEEIERAVAIAEYPIPPAAGYRSGMADLIAQALNLVPPTSLPAGRLLSLSGRVKNLEEGDHDGAQEALGKALEIANREGDAALELRTLVDAGEVAVYHGRFQDSLDLSLRAATLSESIDDLRSEAMLNFYLAIVFVTRGNPVEASDYADAAVAAAERLRHPFYLGRTLFSQEIVARCLGRWDAARKSSDRGLAAAPRDPRLLLGRAILESDLGESVAAETYLDRLVEVTRVTSPGPTLDRALLCVTASVVARISGQQKNVDEEASRSIISSPKATPIILEMARIGLSLIAIQDNDQETAREQYENFVSSGLGNAVGTGEQRLFGLLAQAMGDLDQSASHFDDALAFDRRAGYLPNLAWVCCDYSDALLERDGEGDRAKAMSLLDESLAISSELGMRPLMERVLSRREILKA